MLRPLLLLILSATLGACSNMVFSDKPLFTRADAKDAPEFRPGIWAYETPGCPVNVRAALQNWPDCSTGLIYGRRGLKAPPREVRETLVNGDPLILQDAGVKRVLYSGVKPLEWDSRGRLLAYELWPALCGPPPAPRRNRDGENITPALTSELLPGLVADHDNCRARDPAVVRESVIKSYNWVQARARVRWVRKATWFDRYPSDADFTPTLSTRKDDEAPAAVARDAAR